MKGKRENNINGVEYAGTKEEVSAEDLQGFTAALHKEQSMPRVPQMPMVPQAEPQEPVHQVKHTEPKQLINCLRNERIIVRFVPKKSGIQDKRHVLYGGMAQNAVREFVTPTVPSTGRYKNVLTNSEKDFLEYTLGLEPGALGIYKKNDNFWNESNPQGIGSVVLHKQDNVFDLNDPIDYIKYKILLANSNVIAPSLQALEDNPRATYQFVIMSENAELTNNLNKIDTIQKCYMIYGKFENDLDTLSAIIEILEGRNITQNAKPDFIKGKINEWIQKNPKAFYNIASDEYLPAKVLIKKGVEAGIIGKKNDTYYLKEDSSPLCDLGENSTLNNAAKFICSVKNQTLKYKLEALCKA